MQMISTSSTITERQFEPQCSILSFAWGVEEPELPYIAVSENMYIFYAIY